MELDQAYYWLALNHIRGLRPVLRRRLIAIAGSAREVFRLPKPLLQTLLVKHQSTLDKLLTFNDFYEVERELRFIEAEGITILHERDPAFPHLLRHIHDFPSLLFIRGDLQVFEVERRIAVVGSRHPTNYGREAVLRLVPALVRAGITIVSGFALGIDLLAHLAAVDAAGGTLCVLGSGVGALYPASHRRYVDRILKRGAFVSEYPCFETPQSYYFPERNRLISGLCQGTLVVEAAVRSGALITADQAVEQNRELFAVPGRIDSALSAGCHRLIKAGAHLADSAEGIIQELGWQVTDPRVTDPRVTDPRVSDPRVDHGRKDLAPVEERLYRLCERAQTLDELACASGLSVVEVQLTLSRLLLNGLIKGLPGSRYCVA